jgi:hypothetical protein|nr:MAG TPA: hypothetical protein [Caudoviricetes sp.]
MTKRITITCFMVLAGFLFFMALAPSSKPASTPVEAKKIVQAAKPAPQDVKPLTDLDIVVREVGKYDWDAHVMLAIAKAESNLRKDAIGDTNITYVRNGRTYGYSVGVFQIRILEGREACDTFDIPTNVSCAYRVYKSQGLRAWSVFTNGLYRRYL